MINTVYFMAVLMIFLRMLTFFIIVPVFFPNGTPNVMKFSLAGIVAFMLAPGVGTAYVAGINSNYTLVAAAASEIINGLILGYITNLCFMVIRFAGQLMDMQIGFSMMSIYDPSTQSNETFLERLMYWFSLMLFFLVDGHHMLIRAMVESFNIIAPGKFLLGGNTITIIFGDFIQFFNVGFKIALPIVLILLITEITMGLVSRTVPQLNVMILGMPVKLLVGLTCFSMALPMMASAIVHLFNSLPDIYKGIFHSAPMLMILASEEKTEEATPKKKRDARKKGQIPKSKEVPLAVTLAASTLVISVLGAYVGNNLMKLITYFLSLIGHNSLDYGSAMSYTKAGMLRFGMVVLPTVLPIMILGVVGNVIQTGPLLTDEPLKPKFDKLNPINGFKRIFSMRTVMDALKDIAVVTVVGSVGYSYLKGNYYKIFNIGNLRMGDILPAFKDMVVGIFFKVTLVMVIIAIIDYAYQRYMFNKDLRMTKQEIKEEFKQDEGDPQIKSRIRQKQREMANRRMMQAVPSATVVVTNPTHIAVALKYDEGDEAPMVVAKGSDYVAIKIKEIAKENNVPIIENKPLARLIFNEVELDKAIPMNMYQAVAEILALIYKMKKKRRN